MLKKISIITPSFNQGEFIEDNILSIKNQTYKNIEHIVIDGGSTDNTLEILKSHQNTYNLSWISEPDRGMYHAINKGLQKASGDILCYLNTDDLFLPWTLQTVVDGLTRYPEADLLYGDIINLDELTGTIELTFCPKFNSRLDRLKGGLYQPAVFWRRRAYEKVGGFAEDLQFAGDYEYWLRVAQQGQVKKLNEFLAVDRNHYRRKTVAQADQSDEELDRVRQQYGLKPLPRGRRHYIYKFHSYFWTRYFMLIFIMQTMLPSKNKYYWYNLLSCKDIKLPPPAQLMLRLIPLIGKSRYPWLIAQLPQSGTSHQM